MKKNDMFRRLLRNKSAIVGLIIVSLLVLGAIFADKIAPNDPTPSPPELSLKLKPGFWSPKGVPGMPLGTDGLGRCVFSRMLYGARVSLSSGIIAVGIAMLLGITFGIIGLLKINSVALPKKPKIPKLIFDLISQLP
ncbi:MAG TPA: hypothetical protein EYP16_00920, partial [Candidatus Atribacteria bacterium]|nr:hypothetical protein [Candidatus Atribacteria bacterium]